MVGIGREVIREGRREGGGDREGGREGEIGRESAESDMMMILSAKAADIPTYMTACQRMSWPLSQSAVH